MKHTRYIALVLAFVMVLGLLPASVSAADLKLPEKFGSTSLGTRVNPLYENVLDPEDFDFPVRSHKSYGDASTLATQYVTIQKAGQQMRDYMEARTESFSLYVQSPSSDYNEIIDEIFVVAFEHTGQPKEGDSLMWQYAAWSGSVERSSTDEYYQYCFTLDFAYYTTAAQEKELDSAVSSLLSSLNVSGKSDYQKVCAVYDYMCDNITYDYDNLEDDDYTLKFTAYAALKNKTAVCQGYALLFYRLMLEMGIDARLIAGDGGGPHAWNIVKLGDVYYNLDSTWDAGMDEYQFFLLNSENFVDHYRYLEYMTTQFHTDYPISGTDYVDGVEGEPEYYFVIGACGDNAYFAIDRDRKLTIAGEGATYSQYELDEMEIVNWGFWTDAFETVVVEEGIERLGDNAFYYMEQITSVTLPDTLKEIGDYAFQYCSNLTSIEIPGSVRRIGRAAFNYCVRLKNLVMNDGIEILDLEAFRDCTALTSVTIPDSVIELSNHAFGECSSLKSVTLSKSLTNICGYVFSNCTSLKDITFHEGLEQIDPASFDNCTSLTELTFPASITSVYGFSGCTGIKKLTFQGNAPEIGYYAFSGVTATAYYPSNMEGWEDVINAEYDNAKITWVSTHTHNYTSSVVEPTCTEQGYTVYTCADCGDSYQDNYVVAAGHSYGDAEFVSVEEGHSFTCGVCGYVLSESCTFDSVETVVNATLDSLGVQECTCSVCGGSYEMAVAYRISGSGRCETAIEAANVMKQTLGLESFDAIIIANGDNFADALAGSYLAAQKAAPILLYRASAMELNLQYIQENLTEGGIVYLLGGTSAVPAEVEEEIANAGIDVKRLAGSTRFDTNLEILREAGIEAGQEILVATGYNFADSLSASATGLPILLVNNGKGELTETQVEFLAGLENCSFTVIGGTSAVSDALEAQIGAYGTVNRLSGTNREATSVLVAQTYFENPSRVVLAYSRNFPDGLCGGPLAFALGAPLILTNVGQETIAAQYVSENGIKNGLVLGGASVLADTIAHSIFG